MQMEALPGGEIVHQGLEDLRKGVESPQALLVCMAATRLRAMGFDVPQKLIPSPEVKLYRILASQYASGAHSKYNAWRRRLLSFLRSARCAR